LSLAEMSDRLAQWLSLYVSAQAGPTADQVADWSARLESLALSAWPETSWPYLPRLRSWYLHGLPAPVAPVTEKPVTEKPVLVTPPAPAPVRHLIWLLDQRSICWQDWALQHFRALPGQWQITLVCRFAALQAELSPHFQVPVYTLPPEPEAARQFLATLQADLILWSDPELDPLQHWLSRSELADLNLSWSGRSLGFDAGHSSIAGHLPQWPLYPLPGATAVGAAPTAMPLSDRPLLICPIPAMGLLPAELDQLQSLSESYQLLFFANAPERVLLQKYAQLWTDLPSPAPLTKVWRQPQELSAWYQQARAMYLPQQAAELYALLARHYGLACCGLNPVTLPWGQSVSADQLDTLDTLGVASENWLHALPATRWAVELQSALHQRRNP